MTCTIITAARLQVAGFVAAHGLLASAALSLGCSEPNECIDVTHHELLRGSDVVDAHGVVLRGVPDDGSPLCTGIQLTAGWYVTAGHCADYAQGGIENPSLDLAIAQSPAPSGHRPLPIFLGPVPERARIMAFNTALEADSPIEVGRVVEGDAVLYSSGEDYVRAEVQPGGPSACGGDSGSGLFVDSDVGPLLLAVFSSSVAAQGSPCTPDGGQQYWARLAAARDWLEQQIGPCQVGVSDAGPYCVLPADAGPSACP